MTDIAIRVENLSKLYRIGAPQARHDTLRDAVTGLFRRPSPFAPRPADTDLWALKDVSFEVKQGEVVGVIGRNGAGKSTLLKILSRITEPTSGRVELHGRVASLLEVGTGFHPELTGRENIYLNGAILGMRRRETDRKFDEIVDFAEIDQFLDTPVKRYSSGMYLRLAFAVAAHLEPEVLLIDEALAVGDIAFQAKCIGRMGEVSREGHTVMTVSHNMQIITNLCHSAVWLDHGYVRLAGKTDDVVSNYVVDSRTYSQAHESRFIRSGFHENHDYLIEWVEVFDDTGKPSVVFESGEYINLVVAVSKYLPSATYFEWGLLTNSGMLATSGGTYMKPKNDCFPPESGLLYIRIGPVLIAQGHYELILRIGTLPGIVIDQWEAATIVISNYVPEPGGIAYEVRRGVTYIQASYEDAKTWYDSHKDMETTQ